MAVLGAIPDFVPGHRVRLREISLILMAPAPLLGQCNIVHVLAAVQWSLQISKQCITSPHNSRCNVVYSTVCVADNQTV